jgi:tetratricopeptide (TPR) repeat protein
VWLRGDNEGALADAQRSWDLYAELGDLVRTGKAATAVGWYHAVGGAPAAALPCYDRALEALDAAGDRPNALIGLADRGRAWHELGRYEQAMDDLLPGLRRARADGDVVMEAQCASWLADTYQAVGDDEAARERRLQAYTVLAVAGHPQAADFGRKLAEG